MIPPTVRRLSAVAVILALAVVLAPPVGAQPHVLQKATPTEEPRQEPNWLDEALSFAGGLLPKAFKLPELPRLPLLDLGGTGSCIDPLGNPCVFIPRL